MPLLFIEVDNCHETAEELALKLEKYARFFRRTAKDTDGKERPMWRTRWTVPEHPYGEAPHPPVLLVFNHIGERNPDRTVPPLQELTRHLWQGAAARRPPSLRPEDPDHRGRTAQPARARPGRPGVPPVRPRPPAAAPAPDPDRQAPAWGPTGRLIPGGDAGEWEIPRIPLQYERAVLAGAVVREQLRTTATAVPGRAYGVLARPAGGDARAVARARAD
ncbi:hypothetical protein ACWEK2_29575 [Streptomyces albidoflavus]